MEQKEIRVGMLFKALRRQREDTVDLITDIGGRGDGGEWWFGWRVWDWEGGKVLLDGGTAGPEVVEEYLGDWELGEALAAIDRRAIYYPRYRMSGSEELIALDAELKCTLRENWGEGRMIVI
jgi:hypothetical protein